MLRLRQFVLVLTASVLCVGVCLCVGSNTEWEEKVSVQLRKLVWMAITTLNWHKKIVRFKLSKLAWIAWTSYYEIEWIGITTFDWIDELATKHEYRNKRFHHLCRWPEHDGVGFSYFTILCFFLLGWRLGGEREKIHTFGFAVLWILSVSESEALLWSNGCN